MRWGITKEMQDAQMATDICLHEIQKCQEQSVGPNFIASSSTAIS